MKEPEFENLVLPVYVINLEERKDRLEHIKNQFVGKSEFELRFMKACKHSIGAVGLWSSIVKCVEDGIKNDEDFIIICEDDHQFTDNYDRNLFIKSILKAHEKRCDILNGGIGGFTNAVPIGDSLYWVDTFWCTQFIVIYRKFYEKILKEQFAESDTADGKFSKMTNNILVIYPFVSNQFDFGYSDVTSNNNQSGLIVRHFKNSQSNFEVYRKVFDRFISKTDKTQEPLFSIAGESKPYHHDRLIHRDKDALEIIPFVKELINFNSVVDFGCGLGNFLHVVRSIGVTDILGLDGAWIDIDNLRINPDEFTHADLDKPIKLARAYDLAICLEVAEHLKEESSDILVKSLVEASDVILFSAAIPGQGGQNHINEQWTEYWVEKFAKHGYRFFDVLRPHFWDNPDIFWWYRQNIFLIIKEDYEHSFANQKILNLIHPEHYKSKLRQSGIMIP
ncbi:methyltransferase domain-containing protein [Pedobacter frigoris]|uniref:methyltransferase domain-containing protein n=1 Tax=Pedobacter frigoris TaxID=2571272 RepID=UPI00292F1494|nr:methyltransferase domain-containing protein [Pedobacter frigoris]